MQTTILVVRVLAIPQSKDYQGVSNLADLLVEDAPGEIAQYYAQSKHYFGRMDGVKVQESWCCYRRCWLPEGYDSQ